MNSRKAVVFILLGQSNAVGHGVLMEEKDIIKEPLKNVFGLHRNQNQSFAVEKLTWSGYVSGGMNLGETQDHTYSLANCLAALWQGEVDGGAELPDLYILQIAIGAQGVTEKYMWHPQRAEKLIPGKLGEADISLFPFTCHILSLLEDSFREMGKDYEILGLHWRGGEEDVSESEQLLEASLGDIYRQMLDRWNGLLHTPPVVLHRIVCPERMMVMDPTGQYLKSMHCINRVFETLAGEYENISLFDVRNAPFYDPSTKQAGIFLGDFVHYTPQTNRWVARRILEEFKG